MAAPEQNYRTSENDEALLAELEAINTDENPIERERKLNQFYEKLDEQEADDALPHEQGTIPSPRT
ncbi:MAG: hypothetical protein ABI947_22135 [Chloroflexota bacterium]